MLWVESWSFRGKSFTFGEVSKKAIYGVSGSGRWEYCSEHALEEMVNIASKRYASDECSSGLAMVCRQLFGENADVGKVASVSVKCSKRTTFVIM